MKLMIVVLADRDADGVISALVEADYRVTRVASSGGFFRSGNTTLFIGTDEERVDRALEIIRTSASEPDDPSQRRATAFILNLSSFEQL